MSLATRSAMDVILACDAHRLYLYVYSWGGTRKNGTNFASLIQSLKFRLLFRQPSNSGGRVNRAAAGEPNLQSYARMQIPDMVTRAAASDESLGKVEEGEVLLMREGEPARGVMGGGATETRTHGCSLCRSNA